MSTPETRARHRDNAAKLGKFQLALQGAAYSLNRWIDTRPGQVSLLVILAATLLLAATMGH